MANLSAHAEKPRQSTYLTCVLCMCLSDMYIMYSYKLILRLYFYIVLTVVHFNDLYAQFITFGLINNKILRKLLRSQAKPCFDLLLSFAHLASSRHCKVQVRRKCTQYSQPQSKEKHYFTVFFTLCTRRLGSCSVIYCRFKNFP